MLILYRILNLEYLRVSGIPFTLRTILAATVLVSIFGQNKISFNKEVKY